MNITIHHKTLTGLLFVIVFIGMIVMMPVEGHVSHMGPLHHCIHNDLHLDASRQPSAVVGHAQRYEPVEQQESHNSNDRHDQSGSGRHLLSHFGGQGSVVSSPIRVVLDTTFLDQDLNNRTCNAAGDIVYIGKTPNVTLACDAGQGITTNCFVNCSADQVLTTTKRQRLVEILNGTLKLIQDRLSVYPVQGNLFVSPTPNCGVDNGLPIPSKYWTGNTGSPKTDLLLFISVRPTLGQTVAYAVECQKDQNNRPILGQINWDPKNLGDFSGNERLRESLIRVGAHELVHVLGFTRSKYVDFLDVAGDVLDPHGVHNKTRGVNNVVHNVTTNGHTVDMIVTPNVIQAGQSHFGCNDKKGVLLEDGGGSSSAGSHWEQRTLGNELMTSASSQYQDAVFSNITLALLHDTGFYQVNFDKAETLAWGRNLGCNFTRGDCGTDAWPQGEGYRCTGGQQSCSFDRQHKGICQTTTYTTDLPIWYQHFPGQPKFGGVDSLSDHCPYVRAFNNRDCIYDSGLQFGTPTARLERTGNSSRCFMSTLEHRETLGNQAPMLTNQAAVPTCYEMRCVSNTGLNVRVGDIWVDCSPGNTLKNRTVFGFSGIFHCPRVSGWMCEDFETLKSAGNVTAWPTISSVSPTTAPVSGGTSITLTGDNLKPEHGLKLSIDMLGFSVSSITSISKTQIVFVSPIIGGLQQDTVGDIVVTMDHPVGAMGGYHAKYRMYGLSSNSMTITTTVPSVTSVTPDGIPNSGGTRITIVGQHLGLSGTLRIDIDGVACTQIVTQTSSFTRVTCVTPALPSVTSEAPVDMKLFFTAQNNFVTRSNALLVGPTWPSLTHVFPKGVATTTGMWIVLFGNNIPSATFSALLGDMACQQMDVISSEIAVCQTQGSTLTSAEVVDINVDGGSRKWMQGRSMMTIDPGYAHISGVSPSRGPDYGGSIVTISGTNLRQLNSTSRFNSTHDGAWNPNWPIIRLNTPTTEGVGCEVISISDTSVLCRTQMYSGMAAGTTIATSVNITGTGYGAYVHQGFTFDANWLSVSGVEPNGGSTLGTSFIRIFGQRFPTSGTLPVVRIRGISCVGVIVISSTEMTCKLGVGTGINTLTSADVVVTDAQGRSGSLSNSFVYDPAWPRFSLIKPSKGNWTGGELVTLTGDGFVLGTPVNVTIGDVECINANSTSPTQIVCTTGKQSQVEPGKKLGFQLTIFHGNRKILSPPDVFFYEREPTVGPPPPWPWYYWIVFGLILLIPYMIWGGIRASRKPVDLTGLIVYRVHMKLRKGRKKKRGEGGEVMSFGFE